MRQLMFLMLLLVQGTAWGAQFAMLKLAMEGGYDEVTVLFIALFVVSVCYFVILVARRSLFRLNVEILVFLFVTGLLGYVIPLLAVLYAAPYLPAGIMTMIACLTPVVTVVVALLLRTEKVSRARVAAVVLGVVAAFLVVVPELSLPGLGTVPWMVLVGLVPLCYGVESIYVSARWPASLDAWQVGFGEAAAAAVLVLPLVVLFGDSPPSLQWSVAELGIALFVLLALVEIVLYFYIIQNTGGVLVNFGLLVALFAGIGWGIAMFGEDHDAMVWGAAVVMLGSLGLLGVDAVKRGSEAASGDGRGPSSP